MIQLRQLLVVKAPESLLVRAELVEFSAKFLRRSCGPMVLEGGTNAARRHETVGEEQETLRTSEDLHEGDTRAMYPLGVFEVGTSVGIIDIHLVGIMISPFNVQNEARFAKDGRFKVALPLSAFRDASADFVKLWRRNSKGDREA